jgi:hypothetical protein
MAVLKLNNVTTLTESSGALTLANTALGTPTSVTLTNATFPAGHVLQVIQTHVDTASSQSLPADTATNVTGINATITPSSTSSKILIHVEWTGATSSLLYNQAFGLKRDTTPIGMPADAGSRISAMAGIKTQLDGNTANGYTTTVHGVSLHYLDSPASTSSITYHLTAVNNTAITLYNQRSVSDTDANHIDRTVSNITLMEISV